MRIIRGPRSASPFAGFTRLSTLLGGMTPGQALNVSSSGQLLIDVQMADANRIGQITVDTGGVVRWDDTLATRLLCDGIYSTGDVQCGTSAIRHPYAAVIDLCGPMPTVNDYSAGERTALDAVRTGLGYAALGTGVARGPTHQVDYSLGNNGIQNDRVGGISGAMRGIINDGGTMKFYGQLAPLPNRLNAHYISGTTLTLETPVTCSAGDEIWITPSGHYDPLKRTEKRIIAANVVNSTTVTITVALGYARWGLQQYRTNAGVSLTADAWTVMNFSLSGSGGSATYTNSGGTKPNSTSRQEIDQRAHVIIRNRSIKFNSYDVSSYSTSLASSGFGQHTMTMGMGTFVMSYIQSNDFGQLGFLGRYGAHPHMTAYNTTTGALTFNPTTGLTDGAFADGQCRVEGCTFGDGHNRGLNMHGAINAQFYDNAVYNSVGNAYHEEDGSEEPDVQRNILIAPQDPGSTYRLKVHENTDTLAGMWFASQRGTRKDNWAVDCPYIGWVNSFPFGLGYTYPGDNSFATGSALVAYNASPTTTSGCLGLSGAAVVRRWPYWDKTGGTWDGNSALSCGLRGGFARACTIDNAGNQYYEIKFQTTTDGFPADIGTGPTKVKTILRNARHFKCGSQWASNPGIGGGGYFNSPATPDYDGWSSADNYESHFEGRTDPGFVGFSHNHILVRESLNHESNVLASRAVKAFATYHGTLLFYNISVDGFTAGPVTVVNAHYSQLERNCTIESWESYTNPLMTYSQDMPAWAMTTSSGTWHTPSHAVTEYTTLYDSYTGTSGPPGNKYQNYLGTPGTQYTWTFGMLYDHYGLMGKGPTVAALPYTHIVFNLTFFTTASALANSSTLEDNAESVRTTTPMMGIGFNTDTTDYYQKDRSASTLTRVDSSHVNIAGASIQCAASTTDEFFPIMKNWAIPVNTRVRITRPGETFPGWYLIEIWYVGPSYNPNAAASDHIDIGVPWPSGTSISNVSATGGVSFGADKTTRPLFQAATANAWWKDTANNEVWVRIYGRDTIPNYALGLANFRVLLGVHPSGLS